MKISEIFKIFEIVGIFEDILGFSMKVHEIFGVICPRVSLLFKTVFKDLICTLTFT